MKILEIRDRLIRRLWDYLGCPVVLADQVQPEASVPFGIYSFITPYAPTGELGDYAMIPDGEGVLVTRREMTEATFSFTFCSQDRTGEDGVFIRGADEAMELADRAVGWFSHVGYEDISEMGVTIVEVGQAQDRTTLIIDEAARRVGFDVRIRYTRVDTRRAAAIATVQITEKE